MKLTVIVIVLVLGAACLISAKKVKKDKDREDAINKILSLLAEEDDDTATIDSEAETHSMGKYFSGLDEPQYTLTADHITSQNDNLDEHWKLYRKTFGKSYSKKEEKKRRTRWETRVYQVVEHNLRYKKGRTSSRVQINTFADLSKKEIKSRMGYKKIESSDPWSNPQKFISPLETIRKKLAKKGVQSTAMPTFVDWVSSDDVTAIKNQETCGSCWAFSAVSAIESYDSIYNLKPKDSSSTAVSMSEQQLIDCASYLGNEGCSGGNMYLGFVYVGQNMGISSEASYPYTNSDGTCSYDVSSKVSTDIGFYAISSLDEDSLQYHTANVGPMSIAVAADNVPFIYYESGVVDDTACSNSASDLDHGVNIVGFGTNHNGKEYWTVRNSWGTSWGDEGYLKIARNADNMCGIAWEATFPAMSSLTDDWQKQLTELYEYTV